MKSSTSPPTPSIKHFQRSKDQTIVFHIYITFQKFKNSCKTVVDHLPIRGLMLLDAMLLYDVVFKNIR